MALSRCRISKNQQAKLLEMFLAQVTARTAAELAQVHRNSAILYFHKLRQCIASHMAEVESELAVFECDENYFGGVRKGKRGRGAASKACVFDIFKRGGRVYALLVADASRKTLLTALKTRVKTDSVVYTDSLASYSTRGNSHQWNRELLEPVQARATQLQRHSKHALLPVSGGMRVPLQLWQPTAAACYAAVMGRHLRLI